MARKRSKKAKPRRDELAIAIGGEGISPSSVGIRVLAELLQAAASVVEVVAKKKGLEAPMVALEAVRDGSAGYAFKSSSDEAGVVFARVYDLAKTRGEGASPEERHALKRLHADASKVGPLRMQVAPAHRAKALREILVAAPVDDPASGYESYLDVYGRLVGLYVTRKGAIEVHVRLEEGRTEAFVGDEALMARARDFFNKSVRARVVCSDDGKGVAIETIDEWASPGRDYVDAVGDLRDELVAEGVEVDSSEWLRELRGDD